MVSVTLSCVTGAEGSSWPHLLCLHSLQHPRDFNTPQGKKLAINYTSSSCLPISMRGQELVLGHQLKHQRAAGMELW